MHRTSRLILTTICLAAISPYTRNLLAADNSYVPAYGNAVVLFDGKDLSNFDSFLKTKGLNSDPDHVFTLENGVFTFPAPNSDT